MRGWVVGAAGLICAFSSAAAFAVPATVIQTSVISGNQSAYTNNAHTVLGGGTADVQLNPAPAVFASAQDGSSSYAFLRYYVGVTLANPNSFNFQDGLHDIYVPITVSYAGGATGGITPPGQSTITSSQVYISGPNDGPSNDLVIASSSCTSNSNAVSGSCGNYAGSATFNFLSLEYYKGVYEGAPYQFNYPQYLKVEISASAIASDGVSATAFADPVFSIGGPDASMFQLSFAPDVGNSPPQGGVPETSTWALMIIGFGAVGGAMRRRRAVAA